MKLIRLSQRQIAIVDEKDFERLSLHKWYALKDPKTFYAVRNVGTQRDKIMMHNEILGIKGVDHKDGNGLHNWRENLRPANQSQNGANRFPNNGRKFKGVVKSNNGTSWQSWIKRNGKRIYIGSFKTQEAAAKAYDIKASELFGEYARLNFTEEKPEKKESDPVDFDREERNIKLFAEKRRKEQDG